MRSRRLRLLIQMAAVVGIVMLVVPMIGSQLRVAGISANDWCGAWVAYQVSGPGTPDARFELFNTGGPGWQCYAVGGIGGDRHLGPLGIIPGPPNVRPGGVAV